jgi:hypothetical protein
VLVNKIDLAFSLQCQVKYDVSSVLEFGLLNLLKFFHFYLCYHVLQLLVLPFYFEFESSCVLLLK